jgi:cell division protein FtsW
MLRSGQALLLILISLLGLGVVGVHSAGVSVGGEQAFDLTSLLSSRTTMLALMAVLTAWAVSHVPVRRLAEGTTGRWLAPLLLCTALLLLLMVHVPGVGREVNGARRWLTLGGFSFQPSEVAKWSLLVILAWYVARKADVLPKFKAGFLPGLCLITLLVIPVLTEDLGTAVLMFLVGITLLVAAGCRVLHAACLVPPALCAFVLAVITSPYRVKRIIAFMDPYADPSGIGYHVLQSMSAISSGGLAGRGLGHSVQKHGYLPEDTTDFIFAILSEELGIAGVLLIISLYVLMILLGLSVAKKAGTIFEKTLVIGVILTIGLQALINVMVVVGLAPTKGIALPLLSSGGTGWLLTAAGIGFIWAVDRASEVGLDHNSVHPLPRPA